MSQKAIVQKIKQTQKNELNELMKELCICDVCKKNKPKLYVCKYINCDQAKRLLCKRCGAFIHDDDYDHEFNIHQSYIEEVKLELAVSAEDEAKMEKQVKEMHLMVKSMEEEKTSGARFKFETKVAFGPAAIDAVGKISSWSTTDNFTRAITLMGESLSVGNVKEFGTELKTLLFDIGDFSLERAKECNEGALVAGVVLFGLEVCWHTFRLIKGDLSLKNYGKKVLGSAAMATGAMVGNIGGTAVGAAIGTILFPFVGTTACGVIGGLLGAIFVGGKAKQAVEESSWFSDKNEQEMRHELIKEALIAFGFSWKDINDKNKFNADKIAKKYRTRAKEAHPDRGGSDHQFCKLNAQLSILLALLQNDEDIKEEISKKIKAITL